MKLPLLLSLLLCATSQAADLTLAWDYDEREAVTFNMWKESGGKWQKVNRKPIEVRSYLVNAQPGTHRYAVTAYDGKQDSDRSKTLAVRVDVTVISE